MTGVRVVKHMACPISRNSPLCSIIGSLPLMRIPVPRPNFVLVESIGAAHAP